MAATWHSKSTACAFPLPPCDARHDIDAPDHKSRQISTKSRTRNPKSPLMRQQFRCLATIPTSCREVPVEPVRARSALLSGLLVSLVCGGSLGPHPGWGGPPQALILQDRFHTVWATQKLRTGLCSRCCCARSLPLRRRPRETHAPSHFRHPFVCGGPRTTDCAWSGSVVSSAAPQGAPPHRPSGRAPRARPPPAGAAPRAGPGA